MSKKAILIGATGLIGTDLLQKLLGSTSYSEVLVIARKKIIENNPKLKQLVINFDEIHQHSSEIIGDDIFCCLGSTVKKTPDLTIYKKIDYQYPLDIAQIAFGNGAKNYHLVSSMGANPKSKLFYIRTKGEIERDLQNLSFQSLHIYRPSLLDGHRKEERSAENIMINLMRMINPILVGPFRKYRSIKIEKVAAAMLNQANKNLKGVHIYNSNEIEKIGR